MVARRKSGLSRTGGSSKSRGNQRRLPDDGTDSLDSPAATISLAEDSNERPVKAVVATLTTGDQFYRPADFSVESIRILGAP